MFGRRPKRSDGFTILSGLRGGCYLRDTVFFKAFKKYYLYSTAVNPEKIPILMTRIYCEHEKYN